MLTAHELQQRLLCFTRDKLADPRIAPSITVETRLFEDQVIDSLKILELIAFLQRTLNRKIPDSQIVLANFRSIATIARVFTGIESITERRVAVRRRATRRVTTTASPIHELITRRELELTSDGSLVMRGSVAELRDFLDATVCAWASELGATGLSFPDDIPLSSLDRAGFTTAFPDKLVRDGETVRSPAVCYHHYPTLTDCTVDASSIVTALGRCYRNEFDENSTHAVERLREFTMREIITVGTPQVVESVRRDLMMRVEAWTKELGLGGAVEVATDPFFTDESRGRLLMQQLLPLKYELRLQVDRAGRTVAAASFNNHHDHFSKAFRIGLQSGESAHTGCVAFGWERWVIAFVNQHGADARNWPVTVRKDVAATA